MYRILPQNDGYAVYTGYFENGHWTKDKKVFHHLMISECLAYIEAKEKGILFYL